MNKSPLRFSASLIVMFLIIFGLVVLFSAFLSQVGVQTAYVGLLLLTFLIGTYVFCGIFSKTMSLPAYLYTGRQTSRWQAGQSIAAGVVSFAVYALLAGEMYTRGLDALADFSGWVLGVCFATVLFAAFINRSDHPTLASMLQPVEEYRLYRFTTLAIILVSMTPLLVLQFYLAGQLTETFFGLSSQTAIILTGVTIGICILLGGIQGVSVARILGYALILTAFLTPIVLIAFKISGNPFPQLAYGTGALEPIKQIDQEIIDTGFAQDNEIFSLTSSQDQSWFNYFAVLICVSCGLASMPHLLQHFSTVNHPEEARRAGLWAIGLILIVITAVPAYAAFYQVDIYTLLLGLQLADLRDEASWVFTVSGAGAIQAIAICGEYVADYQEALAACGQAGDYFLSSQDITVNPSMLVLSSAIINALPDLVTWIVILGALFAVWSTADGLILSVANSLCHDGYVNLLRPTSPQTTRLFMNRFFLVFVLVIFITLAIQFDARPKILLESTLALSAASIFPALVVRAWSRSTNDHILIAGMMAGFFVTAFLLFLMVLGPDLIVENGDELVLADTNSEKPGTLLSAGLIGLAATVSVIVLIRGILWVQLRQSQKRRERMRLAEEHMEKMRVSTATESV